MKKAFLALAALMMLGSGCVVARPYGYYDHHAYGHGYGYGHRHYRGCGHSGW